MIVSVTEWLQRFRQSHQLSQKEFGEALGYSTESVRKFESRGSRPSSGFVASLAAYLGLTDERTTELIDFLHRGSADQPRRVADWIGELAEPARATRAPTNLPSPLTRLVGRSQEVEQQFALLARPDMRLLTYVGSAGVGKTRLALAVAERMRDVALAQDGVYLVELAPVRDANDIERAIADALRLRDIAGRTTSVALKDYLRLKHVLLVLDNLEQFAGALESSRRGVAQQLVGGLLRSAPHLKVLTTSRVRLRVAGEHVYTVQPFRVPISVPRQDLKAVAQQPAVQLFVDRVCDARPDFALDASNVDAVVEICRRLDGIPLAIELAAARCDRLELKAVAELLEERTQLEVLVDGALDEDVRHHTLRASIEWSFDLLDSASQHLFAVLGVFVGGFTLAAASAVSRGEALRPATERDTEALLSGLVDVSLLRVSRSAPSHYTMLETLREFAVERLHAGDQWDAAARAHALFYVDLAERIEPELVGGEQARWLATCEAEHENIRAALGWLLDRDELESAARLTSALWRFWWTRGYLTDGRAWFDVILRGPTALSTLLLARVLTANGILARTQRAFERANTLLSEALALWKQLDRPDGSALVLINLGIVAENLVQYATAREHYTECLDYYRQALDERGEAHTLNNLSVVAIDEGRFEQAADFGRQSLAIFDRLAIDERGKALVQRNLGWIATALADFPTAHARLDSSLAICRRLGDREGAANALNGLALLSYSEAAGSAGYQHAASLAVDALRLFYELADYAGMAESVEITSGCVGRLGNTWAAARGFGVADVLRQTVRTPHFPSQRDTHRAMVAAARQGVDQAIWSAAWAEGAARPDEAIAEMLGHASS